MGSIEENTILNCSGTITYPCGTDAAGNVITCTGTILMPCGVDFDTKVAGGGLQIPYKYQIYRERARLAPCCYWRDPEDDPDSLDPTQPDRVTTSPAVYSFVNVQVASGVLPDIEVQKFDPEQGVYVTETIPDPDRDVVGGWEHETTPSFAITPRTFAPIILQSGSGSVPTKCTHPDAAQWNQGLDNTPPCNGAKTQCPFYTGPKFEYIKDEDMAPGQSIKGQMIQELRSLLRNWARYRAQAQTKWEEAFEVPYIWGRDIDDVPIAQTTSTDFINETSTYTILTKVYWDVLQETATLAKYPSADSGDPAFVPGDGNTPPNFPTIIDELGFGAAPEVEIRFPPVDPSTTADFKHEIFNVKEAALYFAGVAHPAVNIYLINKTIRTELPDLETANEITDDQITAIVEQFIVEASVGAVRGFHITRSDQAKFWELQEGVDLIGGNNKIFALAQIDGKWNFDVVTVEASIVNCEFIQDGFEGILSQPSTESSIVDKLGNLQPDSNVFFQMVPLGTTEVEIDSIYHFYIYDRSASRFLTEGDPAEIPNKRFWSVTKEKSTIEGNSTSEKLEWYRLDNCVRYVVKIKNPILHGAIPAGLDRSWEPRSIMFNIQGEDEESSQQVEMAVVSGTGKFGRSYDGSLMPAHYMIVEPKENVIFGLPKKSSKMTITLEKFEAADGSEEDALEELREEFPDNNSYTAGGVTLANPQEGDLVEPSPHVMTNIVKQDGGFYAPKAQKFDYSYMVELKAKGSERRVGRKWIYGVGELSHFWARDVDISYAWLSNHKFTRLLPDYHKAIFDIITGYEYPQDTLAGWEPTDKYTVYRPMCGDHEVTYGKPGPMFSPYEDCDLPYTSIEELGISINYRIPYAEGVDEKYRGADLQRPSIYKHNVFGSLDYKCYFEFSMGTYTRNQAKWNGAARVRGPISKTLNPFKYGIYTANGWALPVYGNCGREHLRNFKTMHYREYIYVGPSGPKVGAGWLPTFPHVGASSLFETNKPRNLLDQTVQKMSEQGGFIPEEGNFEDAETLLSLTTTGSTPQQLGTLSSETFYYERKSFDDVYKVRKIRTVNGEGVRWPLEGFYFNFRNIGVVWAFQEPARKTSLVRDVSQASTDFLDSTSFITGLNIVDGKGLDDSSEVLDRYGRSVYYGPKEGHHSLKIEDQEWDQNAQVTKYASVYLNPDFPLYFDRFTGEIQDRDSPSGTLQPYTATGAQEFEDAIGEQLELSPVFQFTGAIEEESFPTAVSGLEDFFIPGNLISDSSVYAYPTEGLEGPLDEDYPWIGFPRALNVSEILPKLMPKVEVALDASAEGDTGLQITYTSYPTTSTGIRAEMSNIPLSNTEALLYTGAGQDRLWEGYFKNDVNKQEAQRKGFIGPVDIFSDFGRPIELSSLKVAYRIESFSDPNPDSELSALEPKVVKEEPGVLIRVRDAVSGDYYILVEVTSKRNTDDTKTTLERGFLFAREADSEQGILFGEMEPIVIDQIHIHFDARQNDTTLRLHPVEVSHLNLNTSISEDVITLEPKFLITTGYADPENVNDRLHIGAQDPNYLSGIISAPDISDELEYSGIAEFWRPGFYDEAETVTQGKLRRHWANKFMSWDVEKDFRGHDGNNSEILFIDDTAEAAESHQSDIINRGLEAIKDTRPFISNTEVRYFLNPGDYAVLSEINSPLTYFSAVIRYKIKPFDINDVFTVAKGQLSEGWQDPGFAACLNPKTKIVGCIGQLGRGPHIAYQNDQHVCNATTGAELETWRLFDLPLLNRQGSLDSASVAAANKQQLNPDSLIQRYEENVSRLSTQTRLERYLEKKGRYNP